MTVDEDGRRITFGEYKAAAERAAAGLAAGGIGAGRVVSWMLPTWHESLILAAALSRLSAVQNPIIPIYREREVGFIAAQAGVEVLIVPSRWRNFDYRAMAASVAGANGAGLEVLVCDRALPEADPGALPPPPAPARGGDAPVRWLFYTSGTTADPKGAQHTDRTIMAAAIGMRDALELAADDVSALVPQWRRKEKPSYAAPVIRDRETGRTRPTKTARGPRPARRH